ncbi:hypothetical protein COO91_09181 (plasmid) [Nostoc flagelliforme CCNUN1]|uniref:Uncharacterized protein n=1 Tax=Nostoc flagelliforme CCNUN1 TaxID=2038116 RepID=A0A2K8T7H1_9NOSO|nr:hypothetical protein [Nostoc flagelliforme]AUB43025.1 hypothetical protein COO91_09181 [Nostoc flagelliforme CCNUN1]
MIKTNVKVLLTIEDFAGVADTWQGEFATVPRVGDYITRNSEEDKGFYKVYAVALGDGIPEPLIFCLPESLQASP